jgi:N-6 DNA Methylase/Type I restriction modification DNA specificity domain
MGNELSVSRAFAALVEAARSSFSQPNTRQFALTWLAAARMVVMGECSALKDLGGLKTDLGWKAVERAGLPVDAVSHLFGSSERGEPIDLRSRAAAIVTGLYAELGTQPWDVLPSLTDYSFRSKQGMDGVQEVSSVVSELMLDLVGQPDGWLWLPFDSTGTMMIRALRRGWKIKAASMTVPTHSILKLLMLAIETGCPTSKNVDTTVEAEGSGHPTIKASYVIAVPPFGELVRQGRFASRDSSGGRALELFARSESWAIHHLIERTSKKAVFLVPPGLLFTKGQDQRLREFLLHRGGKNNELEAVVALPPGVLSATHISTAILVTNPGSDTDGIRMVDLGIAKRSLTGLDETVQAGRRAALGLEQNPERVKTVTRDEIMTNEYILTPSRYVRRQVVMQPDSVKLKDICIAIRPPALTKEESGAEMAEVGIPEMGAWSRINGPLIKRVKLKTRSKNTPTLQRDDVILSVKGTIGKAGLIGTVTANTTVVSQSCVALRVTQNKERVLPEYLLMYLRSNAGRTQLECLQVGATMQHVSLATLLSTFQVPLPSLEKQRAFVTDYELLCTLEAQIGEIEDRMKNISQKRWSI